MRDVIQVERVGGTADDAGSLAELSRVAEELLPPLVARLGVSDLGEIEVRQGTWRVRIRRAPVDIHSPVPVSPPAAGGQAATGGPGASHATPAPHAPPASGQTDHQAALSTAVGYFALKSGLAVGHRVSRGDVLGWVDVLGVRKEIVSPADGVIGRFVTEPGDPVEYGQELVALLAATGTGQPTGAAPAGVAAEAPALNAAVAMGDPAAPA